VNRRNSAGRKKTNKEITNGALKQSNIAKGLLTTSRPTPQNILMFLQTHKTFVVLQNKNEVVLKWKPEGFLSLHLKSKKSLHFSKNVC